MNAKEFHDHYGVAVVKQLLERIDVGRIYWNTVKNGNRAVSLRQAFKLAKASAELVPAGEPHMTVLDLIGVSGESPKLIGVARGTNPPGVSSIPEPRVSMAKLSARARPKCSSCGQQCKHSNGDAKEIARIIPAELEAMRAAYVNGMAPHDAAQHEGDAQ